MPGDGIFFIALPRAPGTFGPNDRDFFLLLDPRSRRPFVFDPGKMPQGPPRPGPGQRPGERVPRRILGATPSGAPF